MKNITIALAALFGLGQLTAQKITNSPTSGVQHNSSVELYLNQRSIDKNASVESFFDPALKPFYHGVASGDPLNDRVIIWTRVTPDSSTTSAISGSWLVSSDTTMSDTVASGAFTTDGAKDYTVKVDVMGLQSNTTYYYMFTALNAHSLIGRTRTAPMGNEADHLKFAVVSCSNYEAGYFNGYERISERNDIDAVIHLGDYIYEYPAGVYGDSLLQATGARVHDTVETVTLDQYRTRYSLYRLDEDLRKAHQQHPFVNIWDDHESANDAWKGGAENHDPATEGDWNTRLGESKQAFFEWIPIRDAASTSIYRNLDYGNLVDLIMLDTRIEGRDEQINDITDPAMYDPSRTMLGSAQLNWFFSALSSSTAKWKVIGNQVIFSEFHVGWAADSGQTAADVENIFLDIWDGYPIERLYIINYIESNSIDNVIFLTGDFHSTFAFDVADSVNDPLSFYAPTSNYDINTGAGSVAIEFATPSISSANFDENLGAFTAALIEYQINNDLPSPLPPGYNPNPHMKYTDLDQHGYFILDIKADSAQANWYFGDKLDPNNATEAFGQAWNSKDGDNHLSQAALESEPKAVQEVPAPANPPVYDVSLTEYPSYLIAGIYPNPSNGNVTVQYGLNSTSNVVIELYDLNGRRVAELVNQELIPGIYNLHYKTENLPNGVYMVKFNINGQADARKLVIAK